MRGARLNALLPASCQGMGPYPFSEFGGAWSDGGGRRETAEKKSGFFCPDHYLSCSGFCRSWYDKPRPKPCMASTLAEVECRKSRPRRGKRVPGAAGTRRWPWQPQPVPPVGILPLLQKAGTER